MTKEHWKTLYRTQRIAARKIGAQAYRIARKSIHACSSERWQNKMTMLEYIHVEIAPGMAELAKAQQAYESIGIS